MSYLRPQPSTDSSAMSDSDDSAMNSVAEAYQELRDARGLSAQEEYMQYMQAQISRQYAVQQDERMRAAQREVNRMYSEMVSRTTAQQMSVSQPHFELRGDTNMGPILDSSAPKKDENLEFWSDIDVNMWGSGSFSSLDWGHTFQDMLNEHLPEELLNAELSRRSFFRHGNRVGARQNFVPGAVIYNSEDDEIQVSDGAVFIGLDGTVVRGEE